MSSDKQTCQVTSWPREKKRARLSDFLRIENRVFFVSVRKQLQINRELCFNGKIHQPKMPSKSLVCTNKIENGFVTTMTTTASVAAANSTLWLSIALSVNITKMCLLSTHKHTQTCIIYKLINVPQRQRQRYIVYCRDFIYISQCPSDALA